ncbi:MAG: ribosome-associated translation inhibitor RaiA [Sideroxydans sp.]|jgi:putative sigma-54 modulation protein
MNLNLTGHHLEITPAIREHVLSKLEKVKRHFDNVIDVNVILSVDKLVQKAEATIHISGKNIFAEAEDSNLYVAIDTLIASLDRQILKHKEKFEARRHDQSGKHQVAE